MMERKKRFIVVVDGDNYFLYHTGTMLQRLEYTIFTTKTAEEALDIIAITLPSLVLTEATLPGMSGVELLKLLKQAPHTKKIPVIIYTGSNDPAVKEACRLEGCDAYLLKPAGPEALYAAIQRATESAPRNHIRLNTCLMVMGEDAEGPFEGVCITALSENGMYLNTSSLRPEGTKLSLTIFLKEKRIRVEGRVLYSFAAGKGPAGTAAGMGVKFERISVEDREAIRSFIRKQVSPDTESSD
jgi:CheY-like chemotaxis protein